MNYIKNSDEPDFKILIRAALTYYKQIDDHIKGVKSLSQESIDYYIERLLEITLMLESIADEVYDKLDENTKAILDKAEITRNLHLFSDVNGKPLAPKDQQTIQNCIDASAAHYDQVREDAKAKINLSTQSQI
jgi:hypothetical protein